MPNGVQLGPSEQEIVAPHIFRRHQPGVVAKRLKFATEMTRPGAGLHADEARRQVGKPRFHLANIEATAEPFRRRKRQRRVKRKAARRTTRQHP